MTAENPILVVQQTFRTVVDRFRADAPVLILGHNDADGLSASALLARALGQRAHPVRVRILGRGDNPWADALRTELSDIPVGGLIVTDLGVRKGEILPGGRDGRDRSPRPDGGTRIRNRDLGDRDRPGHNIKPAGLLVCVSDRRGSRPALDRRARLYRRHGREGGLPRDGGGPQEIRHHRPAGGDSAAQCTPPERHG
jgi:hypothetical protein